MAVVVVVDVLVVVVVVVVVDVVVVVVVVVEVAVVVVVVVVVVVEVAVVVVVVVVVVEITSSVVGSKVDGSMVVGTSEVVVASEVVGEVVVTVTFPSPSRSQSTSSGYVQYLKKAIFISKVVILYVPIMRIPPAARRTTASPRQSPYRRASRTQCCWSTAGRSRSRVGSEAAPCNGKSSRSVPGRSQPARGSRGTEGRTGRILGSCIPETRLLS